MKELGIGKCTDSGKAILKEKDCPNDQCVFIDDGSVKGCYKRPPG